MLNEVLGKEDAKEAEEPIIPKVENAKQADEIPLKEWLRLRDEGKLE